MEEIVLNVMKQIEENAPEGKVLPPRMNAELTAKI